MKTKLITCLLICTLFLTMVMPVYANEEKTSTELADKAKSAILIERDTGEVLFNKNEDEVLPPASMTKMMTMLLIMEEIEKGNLKETEKIQISERAASMGGSQIFLEAGEKMSVKDLLKGIAIASGNDASVALAERISGSEEAFVKKMNEKSKALNLKNTKFKNTTGLPAKGHVSTAKDMAIIAKNLLKYEQITDYTSLYEDYLRKGTKQEFWLVNTNKLVRFYDGVDGLKTGFTKEAKYCLTATAKKKDMRVISVVMGAETPKDRNQMVTEMLDYAFNQYETEKLFEKGEKLDSFADFKSKPNSVNIIAGESVSILHKRNQKAKNINTEIKLKKDIELPIKKGETIGNLIVKKEDKILSKTELTIDKNMDKAGFFTLLKRTLQKVGKYGES